MRSFVKEIRKYVKKYAGNCRILIGVSQMAAVLVLSAAWWGILYPEFGFPEDTFSETGQQETGESAEKEDRSRTEAFFALLDAKPGQIKIKSKLLEEVFGIGGNEDGQRCADRDF